jgi:hypothetical protein
MTDTTGFLACDFNPVWHEKITTGFKPIATFQCNCGGAGPTTYHFPGGGAVLADPLSAARSIALPDPQWLDDFAAKAEHHFKTAVDDTTSILNQIIELIQMCEGNILKLKEVSEKIITALKKFHRLYEQTGNYWLAWNFAIKPTIGDVLAIADLLKNANKRIKWLRKRNHLDTKVKYKWGPKKIEQTVFVPFTWIETVPEPSGNPNAPPVPWAYPLPTPENNPYFEIRFTAMLEPSSWAWVRFDIPDHLLEGDIGLGIVMTIMAGLTNPLKVAWEAVPFSWLIDWFVNWKTRLQIEAASLSQLKDAEILGTGWSLKYKIYAEVDFVCPSPYQRYELGAFVLNGFNRRPGLPYQEVSPFRVPLELYNLSILLALLFGKRRRG